MSTIPHTAPRGEDPEQTLAKALANLDKHYGLGTVMRLGDDARQPVDTIPTGSVGLDLATGCGGYPKGRVVEIYGPESSGKTTLALHALASCQAAGGRAAFIDVEHALDPTYAEHLGVQLDDLLVSQPDYGEQALEVVEQLVGTGALSLIVIDSVAALVPLVELQGEMIDQQVGTQARLMSKALRKITALASRQDTCVIFINQLRQKIGVTFGNGEVTTGGNALKFYASLRLDIRRIGRLKADGAEIGARTRVKVVKNKLAPPFRMVELDILYGKGIYAAGEVVDMAVDRGVITRNGAWYSLGDERLGQGRDNVARRLQTEPELRERIEGLLNGVLGLSPEPDEA